MNTPKIQACQCGGLATVELIKEQIVVRCNRRDNHWVMGDSVQATIKRWNSQFGEAAGDREPEASKTPSGEGLPPRMCCAALERAIIALNYRAETMQESINKRPGAAISSIMDYAIKRDREAVEILTDIMQHNAKIEPPSGNGRDSHNKGIK